MQQIEMGASLQKRRAAASILGVKQLRAEGQVPHTASHFPPHDSMTFCSVQEPDGNSYKRLKPYQTS